VTSPADDRLLRLLADGRFHSGQAIAESLGVSRTAVWKRLHRLETTLGLTVDKVRGRGYRLPRALELLDAERVAEAFGPAARDRLEALTLLPLAESTNACATADPPRACGRARAWLAEHQTGGRGRRGRHWVSTFGANIYLSLAWRFELPMHELTGLSMVSGVVVAEVLHDLGLREHLLKWPNDVLVGGRKLSGILLEVSGEADGPSTAVIGIGINVRLPWEHAAAIDQPWTDLERAGVAGASRNRLAGRLIDRLIAACDEFADSGLTPFVDRWSAFDGLVGRPVRVLRGGEHIDGVYRGIAAGGAMILETGSGQSVHHAGEVSLRPMGDA